MDEASLTETIIARLAAGDHAEDIAFDITTRTGEYYPDIEALVKRVQAENESRIVRKQSPLLVLLALTTFLGGMGLIGAGAYSIIATFVTYNPGGDDPFRLTVFLFMLSQNAPQGLYLAGGGIAAVLGSLMGMQKVWAAVLDGLFPKPK